MSRRLTGKTVLVTGASKGIGAAIAKRVAADGASVVVNYASSREGADKVVAEITKAGGKAVAIQGDVSKEADVVRLFAESKKAYGRIDVLVNNAGVYEFGPIEEVTEKLYRRLFDTNVLGLLLASREAAKQFGDKGGNIINIGSLAATGAPPTTSVYSATKGAVDTITKVLTKELGPKKVRVNSVNPGMVETEGARTLGVIGSDWSKQIEAQTPLGRIGQPDDIGDVVAFIASDEARWITGETIIVAGGNR